MTTRTTRGKKVLQDLTRRHIRDAVLRVITDVGVNGLTMDRVADTAGIAKGTLYRYFETKQDLIRDTVDASLAPMLGELRALARDDESAGNRLRRITLAHLRFFENNREFFRVLLHERSRAQLRVGRARSGVYQALIDLAAGIVRDGVASGEFRDFDAPRVGRMVIDANIAVISHRLLSDHPGKVEDDAEFLTRMMMHGMATGENS